MRTLLLAAVLSIVFPWTVFGQFERATITISGTEREYYIHAPSDLTGNPPLVIAAHGAMLDAQWMMTSSWREIADRENLVVAYPQGLMGDLFGDRGRVWDLGNNGVDVQFFLAIIEEMVDRYDIDTNRIYETGFSMGGMLGYTLACAHSDKFAAIAPCSGFPMGGLNGCSPKRNIPILHMHGANDDFVPYNRVRDEILKFFRDRYDCPGISETISDYGGNSRLTKEIWSPCDSGSEIEFISIAGAAHEYNPRGAGIRQGELAWEFLKKFSLEKTVGTTTPVTTRQHRLTSISARYDNGTIHLQSGRELHRVQVFDIQGKTLRTWESGSSVQHTVSFPIGRSAGGVFVCNVESAAGAGTLRIVAR